MILYKFLPTNYALDAIRNKTLKLTKNTEINDLYEFKGLHFSELESQPNSHENLFQKYLLGCFSTTYSNPTMWSHYGDSHKGIVLGFELSERLSTKNVIPVDYRTNIEVVEDFMGLTDSKKFDLLYEIVRVKSSDWGYENEVRLLFTKDECIKQSIDGSLRYFIKYNEKGLKLTKIIIGHKSPISYDEVMQLSETYGEDFVYQAYPSTTQFEMLKKPIERFKPLNFSSSTPPVQP